MGLVKVGEIYYAKTRHPRTNKIIRKSTGTGNKTLARQTEKWILEALIKEKWSPEADRLTFNQMAEDIIQDHIINKRRAMRSLYTSIQNLSATFKDLKAVNITAESIKDYTLSRLAERKSNDTVNLELRIMKRMLNLARQAGKIHTVPYFKMLKGKRRLGYFTREEFEALRAALPDYLKVLIIIAYHTGCRKGELLSLRWDQVDLINGKLSLDAEQTKNETPRVIYLRGELLEAMLKQRDWVLRNFPACEYVFTYDGSKLEGFKRQWLQTLKLLGLKGRKFHDFRRTAISNMVRANIPQVVCQKISGHKNESVFRRYNIITESDLENAAETMANYQREGLKYGHSNKNVANSEETNLLKVKDFSGAGERD